MRISRFLHNPTVMPGEKMSTARKHACAKSDGRHVLAVQDNSALRVDKKGPGPCESASTKAVEGAMQAVCEGTGKGRQAAAGTAAPARMRCRIDKERPVPLAFLIVYIGKALIRRGSL